MKLCVTLAALLVLPNLALSDAMPGMRGINHIGLTVPDLPQAEAFFADVLGCQKATSFGPFKDDTGTFMQDLLAVDPRKVIEEISLVGCGFGSNIELFKYTVPDQKTVTVRNSDIGGHHIAFYVDDIDATAAYLKANNIKTLMGALPVNEGPAAGQSIIYFYAPWGPQLEAISFPNDMAYEKDAGPIL